MIVKNYKSKPVIKQAIKFDLTENPGDIYKAIFDFVGMENIASHDYDSLDAEDCFVEIKTLEGNHLAKLGDYIVKGIHGEFYPCKPDIFEKSYELIE